MDRRQGRLQARLRHDRCPFGAAAAHWRSPVPVTLAPAGIGVDAAGVTYRRSAAYALLLSSLVTAGCGGGGAAVRSGADGLGPVLDDIATRAGTAANDGARVGTREVPAAPTLFQQVNARARTLVAPYLNDLDAAAADRLIERSCELRDVALPLVETIRNPDRAVEQAVTFAASQLEQPLEKRAQELATSLVEAGSSTEGVELLASAAVCG